MAKFDISANVLQLEAAVVGTHLSGKTTTVNSFSDPELSEACGLLPPYGIGVIEFGREDVDLPPGTENVLVPVLTVDEVARAYAEEQGDLSLLGENYSFSVQKQIDIDAGFRAAMSRRLLSQAHSTLRKRHFPQQLLNLGVILSDRERLDGKAYSSVRTPDEDDDSLGLGLPWREMISREMKSSLDMVFLADPRDIPFSPSQDRSDDEAVRDQVHEQISSLYHQACGNRVWDLQGTEEARVSQVKAMIGLYLFGSLVVLTPASTFYDKALANIT